MNMEEEAAVEAEDPTTIFNTFAVVRPDGSAELDYPLGCFSVAASEIRVPLIFVTKISSQFLIAVPFKAWHRLKAQRLLPAECLSKIVLVETVAVRDLDREVIEDDFFLKVWLGLLKPEFESCVSFGAVDPALFSCSFVSESGEAGCVPYAESLVSIADEKFAFMTAGSGAEQDPKLPGKGASKEDAGWRKVWCQCKPVCNNS